MAYVSKLLFNALPLLDETLCSFIKTMKVIKAGSMTINFILVIYI